MPRRTTLKDDYFSWLYGLVSKQSRSYVKLCKLLHQIRFYWSVENDENRCQDGLNLRDRFAEENHLDLAHLEVRYWMEKAPCSVFEVMVALAQRMDGLTYDLKTHENKTSKWFYEMLQNLRLSRFTDNSSRFEDLGPVQEAEVCDTLCVTLDRAYDKSGTGSLFPLKRAHPRDMRKTEIWYQLMAWLDENYGL